MLMKITKERLARDLLPLLCAFSACWAFVLLTGIRVRDPLSLFAFAGLLVFFRTPGYTKTDVSMPDAEKEHTPRMHYLIAELFTVATVLVKGAGIAEAFENHLFQLLSILLLAAGCFVFYAHALSLSYCFLGKDKLREWAAAKAGRESFPQKHILLFSFGICLLAYLPWYLYSFPGIFDPDPINQIEQILGLDVPSDHHPYMHTLLIALFYRLGSLFSSDINFAIGCYTFFQMTFFAFAAGFVIRTLYRVLRLRFGICMAVLLFYATLPFMAVHSILVCKDTVFASALMLFCCFLAESVYTDKWGWRNCSCFFISALFVCTMRTNGWYAFLLFSPFFLILCRKQWKGVLLRVLPVILAVLLIKGPVFSACGVQKGDLVEALHIPIQQVACVIASGREVSEADREKIAALCSYEQIADRYVPGLADSIKELIRAGNPAVLEQNKGEYFNLWLRLGFRYPADYLSAWVGQCGNLLYPDGSYDVAIIEGVYPNGLGLEQRPLIGGPLLVKLRELLIKLGSFIPLWGLFWSMGSYSAALLFAAGFLLQQKEGRKRLLLLLPPLCVIATLFLAIPVAEYFRYAFSYAVILPFGLCILQPPAETAQKKALP